MKKVLDFPKTCGSIRGRQQPTTIMTHLAFLEDTISFYSVDPKGRRAETIGGNCRYRIFDANGNKTASCAIGRYIPDKKYNPVLEGEFIRTMQHNKVLSTKIRHLNTDFLISVQRLHDGNIEGYGPNKYWDDKGLTEAGQKRANELRELAKELDGQSNQ